MTPNPTPNNDLKEHENISSSSKDSAELRDEIVEIHNRLHGRQRTHQQVAKHSRWTAKELENVLAEDEMLFEQEMAELIQAHIAAQVAAFEEKAYRKGYNSGWVKANRFKPETIDYFATQIESGAKALRIGLAHLTTEQKDKL